VTHNDIRKIIKNLYPGIIIVYLLIRILEYCLA